MRKIKGIIFIVGLLFLFGCEGLSEEQAMLESSIDGKYLFIDKVGETSSITMVKMDGNKYVVAFTDSNGLLDWYYYNSYRERFHLSLVDDLEQPYVERIENTVSKNDFTGSYKPYRAEYIIYISKDDITGGQYTESCGKNCTETIDTTIIGGN